MMYTSLLVAALCLGAQAVPQTVKPTKCVTGVHIIAVRGHGNASPPYGYSATVITNITSAITDSNAVPLPYPSESADFFGSTVKAGHNLKRYIQRYAVSCPDTKIVLQGYSEGGISVMNTLCGGDIPNNSGLKPISGKYTKQIIAAVLYGEETRVKDEPYDEGTCANDAPNGWARTNFDCGAYTGLIRSWCDSSDPDCCTGGTNNATHFQYPGEYNTVLTEFVVDQYNDSQ